MKRPYKVCRDETTLINTKTINEALVYALNVKLSKHFAIYIDDSVNDFTVATIEWDLEGSKILSFNPNVVSNLGSGWSQINL